MIEETKYIRKEKFIDEITSFSGISADELLQKGVLETGDFTYKEEFIDRRSVARILHNYIRIILKVKDEEDITKAYVLKDLFDCRVCANHIAQVYLKGIMNPVNIDGLIIFDVFGKVSESELKDFLNNQIFYSAVQDFGQTIKCFG